MKILSILIIIISLSINSLTAQNKTIWLTYGQSAFLYSPGIEANFKFRNNLGIQLGVNTYIQIYNFDRIVNVSDDYLFNFYNTNLGLSYSLYEKNNHKINATAGFKMYYGPEYEKLHYYNAGGYYIYFDSSGFRPDFGIDIGLFYSFKKFSSIIKFDTARNKIRFGIGYLFGS